MIPCPVCAGREGGCQGCNFRGSIYDPAGPDEPAAGSSASPLRTRRPIALGRDSSGELVALANDGTLWRHNWPAATWLRLEDLPQPGPGGRS